MSAKIIIAPGQKYGQLTFVREVDRQTFPSGRSHRVVTCVCDCGMEKNFLLNSLRMGAVISCGCRKVLSPPTRILFYSVESMLENTAYIPFCGCMIWLGSGSPYGRITRNKIMTTAHRFIKELELGRGLLPTEQALHKCDTPLCIRPDHIFVGTPRDNSQDMVAKGRYRNGYSERLTSGAIKG